MVIIRLLSMFFSNVKSIKRSLQNVKAGESIYLLPKVYKENIHFERDTIICGHENGGTIIEGLFIIPKNVKVTFQNVSITPNAHMYIEGEVTFQNSIISGLGIDILMTINNGKIFAYDSQFHHAKEVAIALMKHSEAIFHNCHFQHNGKVHVLIEASQASIESCEFADAQHALWLNHQSFAQTKHSHLHHHSGTQVIVEHSQYIDDQSIIERGEGNGIFALKESEVTLNLTVMRYHLLPQLWMQNGILNGTRCKVRHGHDSGIMIQRSEANLCYCEVSDHKTANIEISKKSRVSIDHCHIHSGKGFGIKTSKQSIINFSDSIIKEHRLAQISASDHSICSIKNCFIKNGHHIGLFVDNHSECTLVNSEISQNGNTAVDVVNAKLTIFDCEIMHNNGNGIMALSNATIEVDSCKFYENEMPHIASKTKVKLKIIDSDLSQGKSVFVIDRCEVIAQNSKFHDSENVQIEICDQSTATFEECEIYNGKSYGIKVLRNSSLSFYDSQLYQHKQAQIIVNDSSVVVNNSEVYDGGRNAFYIQNHSEVLIQDSFISNHLQPQVWIDIESTLELRSVQLTDGHHSDLLAQNQSSVYISDSIIRNEKFRYNVQAVNYSKIELSKTIVENKFGDVYYSENNSFIENFD